MFFSPLRIQSSIFKSKSIEQKFDKLEKHHALTIEQIPASRTNKVEDAKSTLFWEV